MYRSSLAKKLKPAKRAWRGFTNKLKSKLHSLNIPHTIQTTTHRLLNFCFRHLFIPLKERLLAKPVSRCQYPYLYQYHQHHHDQRLQKNVAAIYIDHLYQEPLPSSSGNAKHFHADAETSTTSTTNAVVPEEKSLAKKSVYSIEDAWEAVVAKSPQLRGVDERADEFIYKFREDMKVQRERSLLEYQEMLARGS